MLVLDVIKKVEAFYRSIYLLGTSPTQRQIALLFDKDMAPLNLTSLAKLKTTTHHIPAHGKIPNTSVVQRPVLVYHEVFPASLSVSAEAIESHLKSVGVVEPHWRYTLYSTSHFHSTAHEFLVVVAGRARVLFGGEGNPGAIEAEVGRGDAILLPAGVAHRLLEDLQSKEDGGRFLMVGSYPVGTNWDMNYGDDRDEGSLDDIKEKIKEVKWFERDPLYGDDGPVLNI